MKHPIFLCGPLVSCVFFLAVLAVFSPARAADATGGGRLKAYKNTILVEAESFAEKGGWTVDQQFMDLTAPGQAGSCILLAHGMGKPVADAKTTVKLAEKGDYRIFARTRNWASPWIPAGLSDAEIEKNWSPGKFYVLVSEARKSEDVPAKIIHLSSVLPALGVRGAGWGWHFVGTVMALEDGADLTVKLHDVTGFDGRVDALCFTQDEKCPLPDDPEALAPLRREALGLPEKTPDVREKPYDLVVVGGGIAGVCTAISAARLGLEVALIQDRPVLGGNGSAEVRVHLNGGTNLPPYPNVGNLTNLMGPHGGGNAREAAHYKDGLRLELCQAEPRLDLFLSTRVMAVETAPGAKSVDGQSVEKRITAVIGKHIETGKELRFAGTLFADCTGDAVVGFLAGADWRQGTEAKSEFDEPYAPENPDKMTMGASIQWYTVEAGHETAFPECPWAHRFSPESIRPMLRGDWDWETGLTYDQILDFERIRDNGLRAAFGHWDYMKNHAGGEWAEKTKNREFGWMAFIAGKRESRRLMGDVVLTGKDIVEDRPWPDACVPCTWAIDLHYPATENTKHFPGDEFRTIFIPFQKPPHYAIPYRTLYSRNVENLFMAGRNISVTHVALGTTRVMRTHGMMGEVVGMAASLCKEHAALPRDIYAKYLPELIALMKKGVAPPPASSENVATPAWLTDAGKNVALAAKVRASNEHSSGLYPVKNIHDGVADTRSNASRWVSLEGQEAEREETWVEFTWDVPVTFNAVRVLTGQAGENAPHGQVDNLVLQKWDGTRWADIPGAAVTENTKVDFGLQFPPVTTDKMRAFFNQPGIPVRIWELELYELK